jgi:hypothetical protein
VDAGTDSLAPVIDFAGNRRPYGGAVDVGAYEFGYSPVKNVPLRQTAVAEGVGLYPNPTTFQNIWSRGPGVQVFALDGTALLPGQTGEAGVYYLRTATGIRAAIIIK